MSKTDKPVYSQARHDEAEPGDWSLLKLQDGDSAIFVCPNCEQHISLFRHTIDDAGHVSPSLVCPHMSCDFHEHITLSEWEQRKDNRWQ